MRDDDEADMPEEHEVSTADVDAMFAELRERGVDMLPAPAKGDA